MQYNLRLTIHIAFSPVKFLFSRFYRIHQYARAAQLKHILFPSFPFPSIILFYFLSFPFFPSFPFLLKSFSDLSITLSNTLTVFRIEPSLSILPLLLLLVIFMPTASYQGLKCSSTKKPAGSFHLDSIENSLFPAPALPPPLPPLLLLLLLLLPPPPQPKEATSTMLPQAATIAVGSITLTPLANLRHPL